LFVVTFSLASQEKPEAPKYSGKIDRNFPRIKHIGSMAENCLSSQAEQLLTSLTIRVEKKSKE